MACARAGHGADHRAGHLYRARHARRAETPARDWHPYRGRRSRHPARCRSADGACAQGPGRDRSAHGTRLNLGHVHMPRTADKESPSAAAARPSITACDVAIVGGGMVGATVALALADTGLEVLLIEGVALGSAAQPSFDERTTALGNASRRIFEGLGVWAAIKRETAHIPTIHPS